MKEKGEEVDPVLAALRRLLLVLGARPQVANSFPKERAYEIIPFMIQRAQESRNMPENARQVMRDFASAAQIPIGAEVDQLIRGIERVFGPAPDPAQLRQMAMYFLVQINGSFIEAPRNPQDRTRLGFDLPPATLPPKNDNNKT